MCVVYVCVCACVCVYMCVCVCILCAVSQSEYRLAQWVRLYDSHGHGFQSKLSQ